MINVNFNDVKTLKKGLTRYDKKVMTTIKVYGKTSATNLQNEAKRNAKWTDRTGQARNSITGSYVENGYIGTIRLEGYAKKPANVKSSKWGDDYFQHLEFHHGKKRAILRPTAEKNLPRISKTMARRIGKIKIMTE